MPRSVVLYTSDEVLLQVKRRLAEHFGPEKIKPYTCSFAHASEAGARRVRITELVPHSLAPILNELVASGQAVPVSAADKDVCGASYEDLMQDADRFRRSAVLQFSSPTMMSLGGYSVSFPVLPLMLSHYIHVWNSLAGFKITRAPELLEHVKMKDFKVSCVQSERGAGFQGWIGLEMEKGRSEEEIQAFNALVDFAFYCGTGLHTDEGLGQTRRAAARAAKGARDRA
ncbi:MAG TPA: CRISPR system precrRNA processing endoribonuclease RAMP protein Cas6 [Syntrophorhabdales bacterium]|nr:CRISPR system precrRNA processing endoribonuclease RAMP protein Cas6 [Syntrophorhabdales bacterium]